MDAPLKKTADKADPQHTNVSDTLRKIDSGPSTSHSAGHKPPKQIPVDLVEEESMESFPASDPPGHSQNPNKPEPHRPGQP